MSDTIDLRGYGYAPGGYQCICQDKGCTSTIAGIERAGFYEGDKRSWRCKPCAMVLYKAAGNSEPVDKPKMRAPQLVRDRMVPRVGIDEDNVRVPPAIAASLLIAKAHDELSEVSRDLTNPEEYADVLECLVSLAKLVGVSWKDVETARELKRATKGGLQTANLWIPQEFKTYVRAEEAA